MNFVMRRRGYALARKICKGGKGMADIELVIKIDEKLYNRMKTYQGLDDTYVAVKHGTPLPKGHGNLVDYEELKNNVREYGAYAEATISHIKPQIIIEADTESEDKK